MVLPVSRPQKHRKTGVYYFREKVPADLRQAFGKAEVSRSLHTKDPALAKARHAEEKRRQNLIWQAMRAKPEALPHKKIMALVGEEYHRLNAMLEEEPGETAIWREVLRLGDQASGSPERMERWYGEDADRLLREAGLATDEASRARLIEELHKASQQWASFQKRRAEGDYRPDPDAGRFPEMPLAPVPTVRQPDETVTLSDLFDLWKADHLREGGPEKTVRDFRQKLDSLTEFLGHEDAQRITPKQIVDWTDHLLREKGLSSKTVAEKYLATVKRVFTVGKRKFRITDNPAADVIVEVGKAKGPGPRGFTDDEAKAILSAALKAPETLGKMAEDNKRAIRWGPWLCAYTGARITEMMQLRKQDVETHKGIPCLRISPEAGAVKTGEERLVPIHPHLVEMGFLEMVKKRPEGYVFFQTEAGDDPVSRARSAGGKVSEWVRHVVGIKDERVQPNHAWRHRFKTEARRLSIERWIVDAIQGHSDGSASAGYGEVPVEPLYEAIKKLPRYEVEPSRA
ncbi:DUF6538 domain-containing protein [Rubellimicrobium roseum]|uniref:Integrase n=1 Tax=Rubellimicrobium roseum TaxID=687525 RepID=A0A5C4N5G6_9RHOB|nr:DUF6538 domain-containing protein [Rubellimicrobium roseum]TNC61994.1 integrase [Rubellimicrobium roseum]